MQFTPTVWSAYRALYSLAIALALTAGCVGVSMDQASPDDTQEGGNGGGGGEGGSNPDLDAGDNIGGRPDQTKMGGVGGQKKFDAAATGGSSDGGPSADASIDSTIVNLKPAIVAAGYGGLRVMSFDGGKTWKNRAVVDPRGGDDSNLIRAINYVEGMWVAAGWKIFLSEDGRTWTEVAEPAVPGGWYDCVTSKNGRIIVKTIRSDYGGQNGDAVYSDDRGKTWKDANFATQCSAQPRPFMGAGFMLKSDSGIARSTNGSTWVNVLRDCCAIENFASGFAVEN